MSNSLRVYLLALNRPTIEEEAESVSLPTKDGIITILPKHANLITALEPGILVLRKPNNEKLYYAVFGGIGVISNNEVKIITNMFEKGQSTIKEKEEFSQWRSTSIEYDESFEEEIRLRLIKIIKEWKTQKTKY